jgi:hypothetical protein
MADKWLTSLKTDNAQDGYELAIKLARMGIKYTQPSEDIRKKLRPTYGEDSGNLIASSQVIATHFQTVAAANNHWS